MVKGAVRAYKRRGLADLAGESGAGSCSQPRATCAMAKRLAPVSAHPRVTVRHEAGSPTWDHDGEIDARRDALVIIFGEEPLSGYLVRCLYKTRRKTPSGQLHDCQMERLDRAFAAGALTKYGGAVAELWKAVVGQRARRSHCQHVPSPCVPQEDKDAEIAFLPKASQRHRRCK